MAGPIQLTPSYRGRLQDWRGASQKRDLNLHGLKIAFDIFIWAVIPPESCGF